VRGITTDREELGSLQSAQIKWRGLEAGEQARGLLGQSVRWTVTLLPVRGAILPGGFDFRRQAFFRGLSAYGYSLGAPVVVGQRAGSITETWRQTLRARFLVGLQGDAGGLATALVVGLRGDLSEAAEAQIRAAGLAHILAISGLHVGMVAGALFFLVRLLGGLLPGMSLRLQTHRIAAIVAVLGPCCISRFPAAQSQLSGRPLLSAWPWQRSSSRADHFPCVRSVLQRWWCCCSSPPPWLQRPSR
jgi:competence protein ComEC